MIKSGSRITFLPRAFFLFLITIVVIGRPSTEPVFALSTPEITSISPSSPAPVGTCIIVRARVVWDSDFRSMRMRFGSSGWEEEATPEFERTFCTGDYGPGIYTIRVEVDRVGGNWSGATSTEASFELTGSASNPPLPAEPPPPAAPSAGPNVEISFNPSSATVGDMISTHVRVYSSNPGATRIFVPCGNITHFEASMVEYDTTWYTGGCGSGYQNVRVCSRDVNDPNWENPTCREGGVNLAGKPSSGNPPDANLWTDQATLQKGQCTTLHWETSGADGVEIDGNSVNANGERQVCPPITVHYSLKAVNSWGEAARVTSVVVNAVSQGNIPPITSQPKTNFDSYCSPSPTRLAAGKIAVVSDQDSSPLNVYEQPDRNSALKTQVPTRQLLTIVSGPQCKDGYTLWQVGYEGKVGWAVEAGPDGSYLLVPNGMPLPGAGAGDELSSTLTSDPGPTFQNVLQEQTVAQNSSVPDKSSEDWISFLTEGFRDFFTNPVFGAGISPTYPRKSFDDGNPAFTQCTEYVQTKRPDAVCWLPEGADAGTWADKIDPAQARFYGITVDENPQIGDIAVWNSNCGMGSKGHVAYVVDKSTSKIWVFEANRIVKGKPDGKIYDDELGHGGRQVYSIQKSCMKFIHKPIGKIDTHTCGIIVDPEQIISHEPLLIQPQDETISYRPAILWWLCKNFGGWFCGK